MLVETVLEAQSPNGNNQERFNEITNEFSPMLLSFKGQALLGTIKPSER